MGSPMELPWWNCCICILVFCIWLYWIGFAWYRTGKIQTWLFIYQADMSIHTHTPLLNMLSCTPCIRKIHAGTPTKKKCIRRCCEPFKQGVPVSRRGSWGSKSERSRNRSHKRASQSPGGQSESDESNLFDLSDCILFCILSFRRTWNAHRTRQVWSCETCETCERWSFDMCLALRCGCRCVLRRTPWICDSRCQAEESELFSQAEDEWSGTEAKINEEMKTCFFLAAVFICSLATRATSIKFWSANAQECCLEGTWWEEATTWRCR